MRFNFAGTLEAGVLATVADLLVVVGIGASSLVRSTVVLVTGLLTVRAADWCCDTGYAGSPPRGAAA
jgi:hypothetical protein